MGVQGARTNPYEILGVHPGAGPKEIKRAYRRQAKRCHSDLTRGSDEHMRTLNAAYAVLAARAVRRSRGAAAPGPAPPPPRPPRDPVAPPEPYLTPAQVAWTSESAAPVAVRLSNRGGPVSTIEPDRLGGAFWAIEESHGVMRGEDLADMVIAPRGLRAMPPGTHTDEVEFLFDGRPARLSLVAVVAPRPDPPPPPPTQPPRPPAGEERHRDRGGLTGVIAALALALVLAVLAAVFGTVADGPSGAGASPTGNAAGAAGQAAGAEGISHVNGRGLIRQGEEGPAQWEVLGVDVSAGRETFTVDLGGSYRAQLESSCVYVGATKVFPTEIRANRYLQTSPDFRSAAGPHAGGPGTEHRHGYTLTFPFHGAGGYSFVYGCSSDFVPAVDLFHRSEASSTAPAATLRGPLHAGGVLLVAHAAGRSRDRVELGPIRVSDGELIVRYRRIGPGRPARARGRSCLRRRGRRIASTIGPDQHSLLLTGRGGRDIPAGRGIDRFQFTCGSYEPSLPVSARLFSR